MAFENDVRLKLFNEYVRGRCELEGCHVIVKHDKLTFPAACLPECYCRIKVLRLAVKKTGYGR